MEIASRTLEVLLSQGRGWTGVGSHDRTLAHADAHSLLVGALVGLAAANPMAQSENFRDRPGGDYFSYQASGGASECSSSCATDARCRAYTFVVANHMCFKKETVPAALANNCCVSGVKLMGAMELSTDRPGKDIRPGFDSPFPDSCETACRNEPVCQAYTWVKAGIQGPTAKCWLKNTRPTKASSTCCVSGVRLPPPRRVDPIVVPHIRAMSAVLAELERILMRSRATLPDKNHFVLRTIECSHQRSFDIWA